MVRNHIEVQALSHEIKQRTDLKTGRSQNLLGILNLLTHHHHQKKRGMGKTYILENLRILVLKPEKYFSKEHQLSQCNYRRIGYRSDPL